ncbi:hypothetical protein [Paenibacillus agricola]|nr:hypothetical protein [Paenibacillus agricola]
MKRIAKFTAKHASNLLGIAALILFSTNKFPIGDKEAPSELKAMK